MEGRWGGTTKGQKIEGDGTLMNDYKRNRYKGDERGGERCAEGRDTVGEKDRGGEWNGERGKRERERDAGRNGTENEREGGEVRVDGSTHAKGIGDVQRG